MAGLGETLRENAGAFLATLQKDPLATIVGQKIEQATDASLASENWALNMEICDIINETDEGPKDAAKAIRKKLLTNAGKNYTVVMYTLTVLETCVKNCGRRFHLVISQKEFVLDLIKLIGPKNDPPTAVQEKVLSLIQNWATAFRGIYDMQGVVQVYSDLKGKGVEFPPCDVENMVPIHTPQRSVSSQINQDSQASSVASLRSGSAMHGDLVISTPIQLSPKAATKLRSELDIVQRNMQVFGEMLNELEPGCEHPRDWDLLQELLKTCHAMQTRIVELVDKVANEQITSELLGLNDELNNLFIRYERFEKRRSALVSQSRVSKTVPISSKFSTKSITTQPSTSLIDFGADEAAALQKLSLSSENESKKPITSSAIPSLNENDEFEAFAQSRTTKLINTPETISNLLPDTAIEFQEMEKWLEAQDNAENSVRLRSSTGAVSSSEFDRFLQERAAAADRLPTIQAQAGSTKDTKKNDRNLFALQ